MIATIITGFVIGLIARAIKPGADAMGWIMTIILGILGSSVGYFLAGLIGLTASGNVGHIAISVFGAIVLLFVYEFVMGKAKK